MIIMKRDKIKTYGEYLDRILLGGLFTVTIGLYCSFMFIDAPSAYQSGAVLGPISQHFFTLEWHNRLLPNILYMLFSAIPGMIIGGAFAKWQEYLIRIIFGESINNEIINKRFAIVVMILFLLLFYLTLIFDDTLYRDLIAITGLNGILVVMLSRFIQDEKRRMKLFPFIHTAMLWIFFLFMFRMAPPGMPFLSLILIPAAFLGAFLAFRIFIVCKACGTNNRNEFFSKTQCCMKCGAKLHP